LNIRTGARRGDEARQSGGNMVLNHKTDAGGMLPYTCLLHLQLNAA